MPSPTGMQIYDTHGHRLYLTGSERGAERSASHRPRGAEAIIRPSAWRSAARIPCEPSLLVLFDPVAVDG